MSVAGDADHCNTEVGEAGGVVTGGSVGATGGACGSTTTAGGAIDAGGCCTTGCVGRERGREGAGVAFVFGLGAAGALDRTVVFPSSRVSATATPIPAAITATTTPPTSNARESVDDRSEAHLGRRRCRRRRGARLWPAPQRSGPARP